MQFAARGAAINLDFSFSPLARNHMIVDHEIFKRWREGDVGRFASVHPRMQRQREGIVIENESAHRRAVFSHRAVGRPSTGLRLPNVPAVVSHDIAFNPLQTAGDKLIGQFVDGAEGVDRRRGGVAAIRIFAPR